MRQVVISRGEDNYWVAECPSLPGCISQGCTKEEAIANLKEAIEGYIAVLEEDGLPVPEDRFDTLLVAVYSGQACVAALAKAGFADNEAAKHLNEARNQLFHSIFHRPRSAA